MPTHSGLFGFGPFFGSAKLQHADVTIIDIKIFKTKKL
jgi:hypothetical protein